MAISSYFKAMLDTIAYTEGTLGVSANGYDTLFNFYTINNWSATATFGHQGEKWKITSNGDTTSAAGRYQFLATTWFEMSKNNKTELNLPKLPTPVLYDGKQYDYNAPFNQTNQDLFGSKLVNQKVSETELTTAAQSIDNFSKMIENSKIYRIWTSLSRALPVGFTCNPKCQATPGNVVNKQICGGSGCQTGVEEIYKIYKSALSKYGVS